jgi:hypothetical protein
MTRRERAEAEQLLIWKAAIVLMDGRTMWPRAMTQAIAMIERRDPKIVQHQRQLRERRR